MDKLIGVINRGLSMFCIGLSSVLVICVVWQVFSRYVLNTPSTTTDELARFLFIWVGLMGAAYTLGQKRHLAIELLEQILENKPAKLSILRLVVNVISLLFASVIMVYGGANSCCMSWKPVRYRLPSASRWDTFTRPSLSAACSC
ncbi:TRAP transporter small permease [Vibrio spartinae]|uniref:TRAP transporter small permease protein n=1 Tax=Vibrio spartinae TaxID=1918945 RepID=A0ABX6R352_9VIBR|nr:TRAP transporter small permease [Vibrio spartinae]QMV15597.1 2,3-diketo-L-gulonate TRAP transporter small permease protein YiaM [Vibrio spartinae]